MHPARRIAVDEDQYFNHLNCFARLPAANEERLRSGSCTQEANCYQNKYHDDMVISNERHEPCELLISLILGKK